MLPAHPRDMQTTIDSIRFFFKAFSELYSLCETAGFRIGVAAFNYLPTMPELKIGLLLVIIMTMRDFQTGDLFQRLDLIRMHGFLMAFGPGIAAFLRFSLFYAGAHLRRCISPSRLTQIFVQVKVR